MLRYTYIALSCYLSVTAKVIFRTDRDSALFVSFASRRVSSHSVHPSARKNQLKYRLTDFNETRHAKSLLKPVNTMPCLHSNASNTFYIIHSDIRTSTIRRESTVMFPRTQPATILRYTWNASVFFLISKSPSLSSKLVILPGSQKCLCYLSCLFI